MKHRLSAAAQATTISIEAGLASRDFVARSCTPAASLIPAADLETFHDAVADRLMQPDDTTSNRHDP